MSGSRRVVWESSAADGVARLRVVYPPGCDVEIRQPDCMGVDSWHITRRDDLVRIAMRGMAKALAADEVPILTVQLAFDPAKSGEMIARVFADAEARTLWLLWKRSHLTNQTFDRDCLDAAKRIRRTKPTTAPALTDAICGTRKIMDDGNNFLRGDVNAQSSELLPYFTGEAVVTFEVST